MIVFSSTKDKFLEVIGNGNIDDIIADNFRKKMGYEVSQSEYYSWRNSLLFVAGVLFDRRLDNSLGVAIEFVLPQSLKRIDCTIAGHDNQGRRSAVIIELKQWESAAATGQDGIVETYVGHGLRRVVHPSYQAWSYSVYFKSFNEAVYKDGGITLKPCAYLHNYQRDGVIDSVKYRPYINEAPLFTKGEGGQLANFLSNNIPHGDGEGVLFDLENARLRPSKMLADSIKNILVGNSDFVLLDDQKEVFEECLYLASQASVFAPKVVIVEGGPGTGKSVIAMHLLSKVLTQSKTGFYITKNAAPRTVLVEKLGRVRKEKVLIRNLFLSPDKFIDVQANKFDVLIVDEAHRLCKKGGLYGNLGTNIIADVVNGGICSIFFIDEAQQVTWKDAGSTQVIKDLATRKGAKVEILKLSSQFRCSGSDGWLAWVDNVLGIRQTANLSVKNLHYDFRVFDDPEEMHEIIRSFKDSHNGARVVAGYCWNWVSKKNPQEYDIVIGDYAKQWNLVDDGNLWILKPASIEQVGCIHTCQGLEVDYIGVIIGPDLAVKDGKLITVPEKRARTDKSLFGYKKALKENPEAATAKADRIIRNTYRTLMTRGMKGCFVYATDPGVRNYLREHLKQ